MAGVQRSQAAVDVVSTEIEEAICHLRMALADCDHLPENAVLSALMAEAIPRLSAGFGARRGAHYLMMLARELLVHDELLN
jgi:hypothetical protein